MVRTPIFTALAIFCFALPFFTVSCQGQSVSSVRGIDLVIGHDVPSSLQSGPAQHIAPNIWAAAALILAIVALLVIAFWQREPAAIPWITGLTAAAVLALLAVLLSVRDALSEHAVLTIRAAYGYYLTILFMAAGTVSSLFSRSAAPRQPGA